MTPVKNETAIIIAKEIKNCTKLLLKTRKFTRENITNGIIDKKDNIEILFLKDFKQK